MTGAPGPWLSPDLTHLSYLLFSGTNVSLHVVSLTGDSWSVSPPDSDHSYIVSVTWVTRDMMSVAWMNRDQTSLLFTLCSGGDNWSCNIVGVAGNFTLRAVEAGSGVMVTHW